MNFGWQDGLMALALLGFFGLMGWRRWKFAQRKSVLPDLLKQGAVIVDVRTRAEFRSGGNPASINIPVGELEAKMKTLNKNVPIVLCCASGARSGAAAEILSRGGFDHVVNMGPWQNTL